MEETLASRLREATKERGMTLRAVGEVSGVPYRSLQNYMSGNQSPGAEPLLKLREALHISIDWLLTGEGSMYYPNGRPTPRKITIEDIQELRGVFINFDDVLEIKRMVSDLVVNPGDLEKIVNGGEKAFSPSLHLLDLAFSLQHVAYKNLLGDREPSYFLAHPDEALPAARKLLAIVPVREALPGRGCGA
jgi:transcriptional regulator with XRE-family HTH domain